MSFARKKARRVTRREEREMKALITRAARVGAGLRRAPGEGYARLAKRLSEAYDADGRGRLVRAGVFTWDGHPVEILR